MKHPISTLSNILYLLAGTAIIVAGNDWLQDYAGIMVILMGIASGTYHWTEEQWAQKADIVGIFAAFNAIAAWQLSTFPGFEGQGFVLFFGSLVISVLIGSTYKKWSHEHIGSLGLINLLLLSIRSMIQFLPAMVLFAGALVIAHRAESNPKSTDRYDHPHALWHLCTALGILLLAV